MNDKQKATWRYLTERNISKDSSFNWFLIFHPLPWFNKQQSCGASQVYDADGKEVSIDSIVKMVNTFSTDLGCAMCGEMR